MKITSPELEKEQAIEMAKNMQHEIKEAYDKCTLKIIYRYTCSGIATSLYSTTLDAIKILLEKPEFKQ